MLIDENVVLKSSTINVWGLVCDLSFSNVYVVHLVQIWMPLHLGHSYSELRCHLSGFFLSVLPHLFCLILVKVYFAKY